MKQDGFQVMVRLWGILVGTLRWDRDAGEAVAMDGLAGHVPQRQASEIIP